MSEPRATPRILKSGLHDALFYEDLWETILGGRTWTGRITNRRKDGRLYIEQAAISPVRDPSGAIVAFVATKRDVSQEIEMEEKLNDARRLETIGMIAGGVAHEVRNPLFAIQTIVAALEKKLAGRPEFGEYVAHIQDQTLRLKELMDDLLTLGRPIEPAKFARIDLRTVLAEALDWAGEDPSGSRPLLLERGTEPVPVKGIAEKLRQIFVNLTQNALAFTPPGGAVRVRAERREGWAVVTVADEGSGIPTDFQPDLFAPFKTNRKGGTGLGLAIVQRIVEAHGGSVHAANNDPHPGATFTVRLPLASKEANGESER